MAEARFSVRRYSGKLSEEQLKNTVTAYRNLKTFNDTCEHIAKEYFVRGQLQIDIANNYEVSKAYVNRTCTLFLQEFLRLEKIGGKRNGKEG